MEQKAKKRYTSPSLMSDVCFWGSTMIFGFAQIKAPPQYRIKEPATEPYLLRWTANMLGDNSRGRQEMPDITYPILRNDGGAMQ